MSDYNWEKLTAQASRSDLSDPGALRNFFDCCRLLEADNFELAHKYNKEVRSAASRYAKEQNSLEMLETYKRTLLFDAPYEFDPYMQYLEWNRQVKDRFYIPRRPVMKPLVDAIQDLLDDKLDEVFLSMPPRTGKTTLLMFLVTMLVGRNPEASNLYSAFSDVITGAFYNGCLEIINDPTTYLWHDIFPTSKIVSTNSKEETLNIDRKKRYPSLTCRSLYGTLNGACDCNGFLISDDLIGGIEEALSKDRMISAWSKVDNNLIPRAKEKAKFLWCGTRWSMIDPAGLRMELIQNDETYRGRRYKIINLPALDENDESNFDYLYGVGFSTSFYQQRRASFERNNDMPSWDAQYQGEPIERSGSLFEPEDMRFYNGDLPDESGLVRIFMAVDPAFGGGDYVASPVCYQYEDGSIYVHDVAYSNLEKDFTQPLLVQKIIGNNVQAVQFAVNKSTLSYKEEVERLLKKQGIRINITSKPDPNNKAKELRIFDKAPEIREFYFREEGKRTKEYSLFMQNVYSFKMTGKNKSDDSVDSLAMAAEMVRGNTNSVSLFKRIF